MWIYPAGKVVSVATPFHPAFLLRLPASNDIFLFGVKSHPAELRLAKFFIKNIREGDGLLDIGAHIGFFSGLVAALTGSSGRVLSIEPSDNTFHLLNKNMSCFSQVSVFHLALSDRDGEINFYEFPSYYSEHNTTMIDQYRGETWYNEKDMRSYKIKSSRADKFLIQNHFYPAYIKIDVEGAEDKVIEGLMPALVGKWHPIIIMEYAGSHTDNKPHLKATAMLIAAGYLSYRLDKEGDLMPVNDIPAHIEATGWEADNIVFIFGDRNAKV